MSDLKQIEAAVDAYGKAAANDPVELHLPTVIYNHKPLVDARTALLTLIKGVCKDAARYQWLRDHAEGFDIDSYPDNLVCVWRALDCKRFYARTLNEAIDLAATDEVPHG